MTNLVVVFALILAVILAVVAWGPITELFLRKGASGRAQGFVDKMAPYLRSGSVLDVGCGAGHIAVELKRRSLSVTTIDTPPHIGYVGQWLIGVPCAKTLTGRHGIPYRMYDGEHLPQADGSFDNVNLAFVLHHAKDPDAVLKEAIRVLNGRGRLIIFEDTPETPEEIHDNHVSDVIANLELGGADHGRTKAQWRTTFAALGLKMIHEESWTSKIGPLPFFNTMFILEK